MERRVTGWRECDTAAVACPSPGRIRRQNLDWTGKASPPGSEPTSMPCKIWPTRLTPAAATLHRCSDASLRRLSRPGNGLHSAQAEQYSVNTRRRLGFRSSVAQFWFDAGMP